MSEKADVVQTLFVTLHKAFHFQAGRSLPAVAEPSPASSQAHAQAVGMLRGWNQHLLRRRDPTRISCLPDPSLGYSRATHLCAAQENRKTSMYENSVLLPVQRIVTNRSFRVTSQPGFPSFPEVRVTVWV